MLGKRIRAWRPGVVAYLGCAVAAALIALPIALERAVEGVHFSDDLGTFPVEVSLAHNGRSTLDTGLFGKVFWAQTGPLGFGAVARAAGPPEAGGTLASYVDPVFIQANVELINDPGQVVDAYADEFIDGLRWHLLRDELIAALLGGAVIFVILPRLGLRGSSRARRIAVPLVLGAGATAVSVVLAAWLFHEWPDNQPITEDYAMPGVARLSFSSPETLEVAAQVKPFIEKNTVRIEEKAKVYEADARSSFAAQLEAKAAGLAPLEGETIILAEGDPQGSFVGVDVRKALYAELVDALGEDAISMRTISGDLTSNGTVAESEYIAAESKVSGDIPTVAVGGDHDSENTWKQMKDAGMIVPDLDTVDVDDLRVSGANDREHKTLFGGKVTNESGISEEELGEKLRDEVEDEPQVVLLHQPDAAAGYLGLDSLDPVRSLIGSPTVPYDDGIADQPPGVISIGHLHQLAGPWVLWNNDGDTVTWTVVDQLGTAGGAENHPTFNRFSTPVSVPLKPLTVRLQYLDKDSGLETGYATISCQLDGSCAVSDRVDVGLPGGKPLELDR